MGGTSDASSRLPIETTFGPSPFCSRQNMALPHFPQLPRSPHSEDWNQLIGPEISKASKSTPINADPVKRRQSSQWHACAGDGSPVAVKVVSPQRHFPVCVLTLQPLKLQRVRERVGTYAWRRLHPGLRGSPRPRGLRRAQYRQRRKHQGGLFQM